MSVLKFTVVLARAWLSTPLLDVVRDLGPLVEVLLDVHRNCRLY